MSESRTDVLARMLHEAAYAAGICNLTPAERERCETMALAMLTEPVAWIKVLGGRVEVSDIGDLRVVTEPEAAAIAEPAKGKGKKVK